MFSLQGKRTRGSRQLKGKEKEEGVGLSCCESRARVNGWSLQGRRCSLDFRRTSLEVFGQARQRSAVDPALSTRLGWPLEISSNSMIPWKRPLSGSP